MPKSNSKDKVVAAAAKAAAKTAAKKEKKKKEKKVTKKEVRKEVDKEVKKFTKRLEGPKAAYKVRVSATLGHISGNVEHGPELKMSTFLHPSLVKGPDDGTEFGPLQAAAAQYGLWRCSVARVVMTPLVGPSAVSGTVERLSLNLTQTPSSTNWGGLGARKHMDAQAGTRHSIKFGRRDLAGPRDGGWWLTDTNAEGAQSAGPLIEIHGLGQTMSAYQNTPWTKELYIVELDGVWEFANYTANPSLGQLDRVEETANASLSTSSSGEIEMTLSDAPALLRFMDDQTAERATATTPQKPGEVIFQVVDTAASLASQLAPPPFGWLIKGGWWFLKKIVGAAGENSGSAKFLVYPSLADAQNNRPAISTQHSLARTSPVRGSFQVTQINAPNMGGVTAGTSITTYTPLPMQPDYPPQSGHYILEATLKRVHKPKRQTDARYSYPPMFVENGLKKGSNTYRAAHFLVQNPIAIGVGENNELISYGVPEPASDQGYRIPQDMLVSSSELRIRLLGTDSRNIQDVGGSSAIHLHTLLWVPDGTANFNWLKYGTESTPKNAGFLSSRLGNDQIWKYGADNVSNMVGDVTDVPAVSNNYWLTFYLTQGPSGSDISWSDIRWPPSSSTPTTLGFLLMGGNVTGYKYLMELTKPVQKYSKVEKLALAMGLDPNTFESDSDSDTDVETASEGESDDESEVSFDVIPQQTRTDDYLRLREQGLSHKEVLEVLSIENPAV
uniref:Capsid protein n=1 Tax=Miniopterus bat astrovirus TaxID=3141885 RepID=A0AAU7E1C4_9VIRU